eukprot:SAG31_NODE_5843_length_2301_cov_1.377384_3_plen_161_part_00
MVATAAAPPRGRGQQRHAGQQSHKRGMLLSLTLVSSRLWACSRGAGTSFGISSTLNISQVAWQPEEDGIYIGGPSITRLPDSAGFLVSANLFGPNVHYGLTGNGVNASIFHSPDGRFWTPAGTIHNHCDSTLFTFGGRVYFIGPVCSGVCSILARATTWL